MQYFFFFPCLRKCGKHLCLRWFGYRFKQGELKKLPEYIKKLPEYINTITYKLTKELQRGLTNPNAQITTTYTNENDILNNISKSKLTISN